MARDGRLSLQVVDVSGRAIPDPVSILLDHQILSHRVAVRDADAGSPITIDELESVPNGTYRLEVAAAAYHPVSRFLNITQRTECRVMLPVNASAVLSVKAKAYDDLPADAQRLLAQSSSVTRYAGKSGRELYECLDDLRVLVFLTSPARPGGHGLVMARPSSRT